MPGKGFLRHDIRVIESRIDDHQVREREPLLRKRTPDPSRDQLGVSAVFAVVLDRDGLFGKAGSKKGLEDSGVAEGPRCQPGAPCRRAAEGKNPDRFLAGFSGWFQRGQRAPRGGQHPVGNAVQKGPEIPIPDVPEQPDPGLRQDEEEEDGNEREDRVLQPASQPFCLNPARWNLFPALFGNRVSRILPAGDPRAGRRPARLRASRPSQPPCRGGRRSRGG